MSIWSVVEAALHGSPPLSAKQIAGMTGMPLDVVRNALYRAAYEGRVRPMCGPAESGDARRGRPEACYVLREAPAAPQPAVQRSRYGLTRSALMGRSALELAWAGIRLPATAAGRGQAAQRGRA